MIHAMSARPERIEDCMRMVQAEFREMPGLLLTRTQIQRLWHMDDAACDTVLGELVARGVLRLTRRGAYVLARD
jgi:hypothetical protein